MRVDLGIVQTTKQSLRKPNWWAGGEHGCWAGSHNWMGYYTS